MILKLSPEQQRALAERPDEPLEIEDPDTNGRYILLRRRLRTFADFPAI
jgi:hypothetical protein